ncbi:Tubulin/FtsZ family, GTPase domain-containing protein [Gorgonomyces haynaldii]|nr:Tubulin/FtsZ family, GTPase domain-containing protein [Gorgonomyces haynaldii]
MIVLQVGQCGIQVGEQLMEQLSAETPQMQYPMTKFRQLLIDTERKVYSKRKETMFPMQILDHGSTGRGNNWAHGYFDTRPIQESMDAYQSLVESLDNYPGMLLIHSLAGGTGSGLGSRLVQEIRDQYPKHIIQTLSFSAFTNGETCLQYYNTLLSLDCLNTYADSIAVMSNDVQMDRVLKHKKQASLLDLNQKSAEALGGQLMPLSRTSFVKEQQFSKHLTRYDPWDFVLDLTPCPALKYCQLTSVVDKSLSSWSDLTHDLMRQLNLQKRTCFTSKLIVRGVQSPEFWDLDLKKKLSRLNPMMSKVETSYLYCLNPTSRTRSMDLAYNSTDITQLLEPVLEKSLKMYKERAYLHWYNKFSNNPDLFDNAFESLAESIDQYSTIS